MLGYIGEEDIRLVMCACWSDIIMHVVRYGFRCQRRQLTVLKIEVAALCCVLYSYKLHASCGFSPRGGEDCYACNPAPGLFLIHVFFAWIPFLRASRDKTSISEPCWPNWRYVLILITQSNDRFFFPPCMRLL